MIYLFFSLLLTLVLTKIAGYYYGNVVIPKQRERKLQSRFKQHKYPK